MADGPQGQPEHADHPAQQADLVEGQRVVDAGDDELARQVLLDAQRDERAGSDAGQDALGVGRPERCQRRAGHAAGREAERAHDLPVEQQGADLGLDGLGGAVDGDRDRRALVAGRGHRGEELRELL